MAAKGKTSHPAYTLHYFSIKGAAETMRLVFAKAGIEYTDKRYTGEEWQAKKEEMPQKMMPCLEIDGKMYCQSSALLRYLGREFNLYGSNNLEALVIDEIMESFVDMTKGLGVFFSEQDPEKKKEGMKKIVDETFPKFVPFICKRLEENKANGFLVGKSMSIGDILLYRSLDFLGDFIGANVTDYDKYLGQPSLKKHFEMVENTPEIKAWIAKRPTTAM